MKGIFEGVTIGEARHFMVKGKDGKPDEQRVVTPAVIDGNPVDLPGNGIKPFSRVLVLGDLRTFERRWYFDTKNDTPIVIPQPEGASLLELLGSAHEAAAKK